MSFNEFYYCIAVFLHSFLSAVDDFFNLYLYLFIPIMRHASIFFRS